MDLFDRSGKFPKLTEQARPLFRQAQVMIRQAEQLQSVCNSMFQGEEQSLTIYHDITVPVSVIKQVTKSISAKFKQTQIHWIHRGRETCISSLMEGSADLSIVMNATRTFIPPKGIDFVNLGYMPFQVYCAKTSPLMSLAPVALQDLQQQVQYSLENYVEAGLGETLRMSPHHCIVSNFDVLSGLLEQDGWAFLPTHLVNGQQTLELGVLKADFINREGRWGYALQYRRQAKHGPVKKAAISKIKECFLALLDQ